MMSSQAYTQLFKTATICVDEYENQVPCGRVYGLHPDKGISFQGTIDLLQSIDAVLEEMNCPQSFASKRVFWPAQDRQTTEMTDDGNRIGAIATFKLKILFRQNASWQGVVAWVEGRAEQSFRSVLELLFLMDSALSGQPETAKKIK